MTRRARLILAIARRKRAHKGYRDLEAKLVAITTRQIRRELKRECRV